WRVVQPNLEQAGLLRVDYDGLDDFCAAAEHWQSHPLLAGASPATRRRVARAVLDHLRRELAIDAQVLDPEHQESLRRLVEQHLREPWSFEGGLEGLVASRLFVLPEGRVSDDPRERSFGPRSSLGRYLGRADTWAIDRRLSEDERVELIEALVETLRGHYLTVVRTERGARAVQLRVGSLVWRVGDGTPVPPDPVRTRWMRSAWFEERERRANAFFAELYRDR